MVPPLRLHLDPPEWVLVPRTIVTIPSPHTFPEAFPEWLYGTVWVQGLVPPPLGVAQGPLESRPTLSVVGVALLVYSATGTTR